MVEAYWGLNESPFRSPPPSRFMFMSSGMDEAQARLQFLIEQRRRLGILWGIGGVGKTLLLRNVAEQHRQRGGHAFVLSGLGLSGHEFLWEFASRMGLHPARQVPSWELWNHVLDALRVESRLGIHRVLLVDDMDRAEAAVSATLLRLLQQATPSDVGLTLLLAADIRRSKDLEPRLVDHSELRIELEGWTLAETFSFLEQSLALAGCEREIFQDGAINLLHEISCGIPRRVVLLANWALLAGAGEQRSVIDDRTIRAVNDELCPQANELAAPQAG